MKIDKRRYKEEYTDSKILREITLFMLIIYGKQPYIVIESFRKFFGYTSSRTTRRYLQDMMDCGAVSDIAIRHNMDTRWQDAIVCKKVADNTPYTPIDSTDPHSIRLARLCTIAKAIPDINLCLGTALENHNYDIILSAAESFVTASKLREYCPYDIDNRTYQRDIRLIDGSLKRYAEYMTSILLMP